MGSAYIQGFDFAFQQGADLIVHMDADFSHSPSYIPQMLTLMPDYDVVVGSRYTKGGRLDERWGWHRRLLSGWANTVWVRLLLGTKTRDATSGFKCWRASKLEAICKEKIRSNGYIFQVEMCYLAEKMGFRIKEIPIYFEERRLGLSKMDTKIQAEAALRVFEIRLRHQHIRPVEDYVRQ